MLVFPASLFGRRTYAKCLHECVQCTVTMVDTRAYVQQ